MREITSHKVNGLNEALSIKVLDEPGSGGACHLYKITGADPDTNPSEGKDYERYGRSAFATTMILFQNGPIAEAGVNGISQEALLAIVKDRLEGFQSGQYACDANQKALEAVNAAIHHLHSRTVERTERGVEGTSAV